MKIRKAYKFRLKPSVKQEEMLRQYMGAVRFAWNKVLALNLERLGNRQPLIWYNEADYWSKLWKASEEYGFLADVPAHCLQQKLRDLDKAFRDAFNRNQPLKRIPRFKKRGLHDSIRFPEAKHIQIENRRIKLPKLGWMGFFKSQAIKGNIKNATISIQGSHLYVSIQVEQEINTTLPTKPVSAIGIDMGIASFAALSTGELLQPINSFRILENKLAKAQKQLSRKKRFSSNWKKQKTKIQKLHRKIANTRYDFLHKSSTTLCKNHAMIVVEDLKIKNMSKSAKGSIEIPGTNVSAKSGLNKSILDQGWGEFRRQLEYKLTWFGGVFVKVAAHYTSQCCSQCSYTDKKNRKTQSQFECQKCSYRNNADINAANNILAAGHAVLACGEEPLGASVKQEPLRKSDRLAA
jgi:putative transposase